MNLSGWPNTTTKLATYREKRSSLSPKPCRSIQVLLAKNESLHITSALTPTLRGFLTHLSDSVRLVAVIPAVRIAAPRPPIPVVHLHRLGGHLLLVGEILLEHVLAVGGVGVLVADIQADAHGGVGIDVEDPAVLDLAGEFVRRQQLELGLALRRVGGQELEAGRRPHVFFSRDLFVRALAGGAGHAPSPRRPSRPPTTHPI